MVTKWAYSKCGQKKKAAMKMACRSVGIWHKRVRFLVRVPPFDAAIPIMNMDRKSHTLPPCSGSCRNGRFRSRYAATVQAV